MPPTAASLVATLAVYVLLFILLALLVMALIREGQKLISWIGSLSSSALDQWLAPIYRTLEKAGTWLQNVAPGFATDSKQAVSDFLRTVLGFAGNTAKQILSWITSVPMMLMMVVVSILSTYFFSRDMEHIRAHVRRIFSSGQAGRLRALSQNSNAMGGRLVLSCLLVYGLTFLESLIVFSVLGVPYPLAFAILSGIADVLPVLGPGTVYLPMAVVYLCLGNWPVAIILVVCWLIVSAIRQVVEPKIVAKSINIHPHACGDLHCTGGGQLCRVFVCSPPAVSVSGIGAKRRPAPAVARARSPVHGRKTAQKKRLILDALTRPDASGVRVLFARHNRDVIRLFQ